MDQRKLREAIDRLRTTAVNPLPSDDIVRVLVAAEAYLKSLPPSMWTVKAWTHPDRPCESWSFDRQDEARHYGARLLSALKYCRVEIEVPR